ncbi:MAG: hypothetical protein ABIO44_04300 [Saprospiraceae bacterium]
MNSQNSCTQLIVKKISIQGNEKTKEWLIKLEGGIKEGDSIQNNLFLSKIEEVKSNLRRTSLFSNVEISYVLDIENSCYIEMTIILIENWLLFPSVVFELVDRNFNVWWDEFNHSFKRINYGLGITHYNLAGRGVQLKVKIVRGYTDKFEVYYKQPYLSINRNINVGIGASYIEYKEIAYKLVNNKSVFYFQENKNGLKKISCYTKSEFRLGSEKKLYQQLEMVSNQSLDTIKFLNPDYFGNGENKQFYFKGTSGYLWDNYNDPLRPQRGYYFESNLSYLSDFRNQTILKLYVNFGKAFEINHRIRLSSRIQSEVSLTRKKPTFNLYTGIGSQQTVLNGYELYQINGTDYFNFSQSLYYRLFDFKRSLIKFLKNEPKFKINLITELFIRFSAAHVKDPFYYQLNDLTNTNLGSFTIGSQISINSLIKLESNFTVNHLGETGFYFHTIRVF